MSRLRGWIRNAWLSLGTIRVRLTLWYAALLALVLVAFSAFVYLNFEHNLNAGLDQGLHAEALQVGSGIELYNGRPWLTSGPTDINPGLVVALYDRSGQQMIANEAPLPLVELYQGLAPASRGEPALQTVRMNDGADWRVLTLPVVERGRVVGMIQVARSKRDVQMALGQLTTLLLVAVPLTLLLASLGGLFLAARALGPIDRMTRAVERITAEDLSRRIEVPSRPDEVGRLAATFNGMLDRLERAFQRQRQFTADAAHELRTPLAILTSQMEVALERPRSAEEYRETLASMRDDADRMGQLLNALLTLSRVDAGTEALVWESLELQDLADDVVAAMTPLARANGITLERGAGAPVVVEGDQTRLIQLLVNLVDNALKYTPQGGRVTVSVARQDGHALLQVADTGVGIAPEHLTQVFERFYRVDRSRSREAGGAGLGLSICRWIVQAHSGEITVESTPGQGSVFTVRLPAAGSEGRELRPETPLTRSAALSPHSGR